jgi:hypothetical protein
MRNAKVRGTVKMDSIQVDQTAYLGGGAEFAAPLELRYAKLGHVDLAGANFQDNVDLTGTQIVGELRVVAPQPQQRSQSPQKMPLILPHWSEKMMLILRNARADSILWSPSEQAPEEQPLPQEELLQGWPAHLELSGFMYRNVGGVAGGDSMANRPPGWFKNWLRRQQFYSSAPYEHLASVLRGQGRAETADEILFERKEQERASARPLDRMTLTLSKWLIGYGYHLWWVLFWIAGILVLGVLVLRVFGEGPRNGMPYGIAYSFDMLLPIIRLREQHYKMDLNGVTRYYFYLHKVAGYVLASFLIAGISGLTR